MPATTLINTENLTKRFASAEKPALDAITANIIAGQVTGVVGPDGAGKTTLMRLLAGLMLAESGTLTVCGADPRSDLPRLREAVSYMPQRFGLYEDLSVIENLNLYADLRAVLGDERSETFARLLQFTDLARFTTRLAGRLSGGMKQKLGLACALIRKPELLLLDEPSVGVDPISRRELWKMVYELVDQGIGVVWTTSYLDEAERCSDVLLLNEGQLLYHGDPAEFTRRATGRTFLLSGMEQSRRRVLAKALRMPEVVDGVVQGRSLRLVLKAGAEAFAGERVEATEATMRATAPRFEDAFVDLLGGGPKHESTLADRAHPHNVGADVVVDAQGLTKRFGTFTAAENITFQIHRGEVFGLLGPNGAGKSTTFKMMCGLLRPTSGQARVVGLDLYSSAGAARARLGYMAQKFSLYGDLSVRQNLDFFSGVYGLTGAVRREAIERVIHAFGLEGYLKSSSAELPLGFKQRLALACAVMHQPDVLFLDEPTSGVDPLTRREFWADINAMVETGVTIMVTTHFLDEAEYCDRTALVYRGQVISEGSPDDLKNSVANDEHPDPTLEDAFIHLVEEFDKEHDQAQEHAA
jgi:ABC-type multidrug transport system ATPase subunit